MKFSQVFLVLVIVNLLNVIVGFSIQTNDVENFDTLLSNWFTSEDPESQGFFTRFSSFESPVRQTNTWYQKLFNDIAQGFTSAVNLVTIGIQIIVFVLWAWVTPTSYLIINDNSESIPILKMLGFLGIFYLYWFNIMVIIKLWKFYKGSDT